MKKKLIDGSEVTNECRNCLFSRTFAQEGFVLCEKSGIRSESSICKKYKYNPLNRVPQRTPEMEEFTEEDFSL